MMYQQEILGGVLIGLSLAIPLMYEGKIAGVSSYASASLEIKTAEGKTSLFFILGLFMGSLLWKIWGGNFPDPHLMHLKNTTWILAGGLVGLGSRLAGGCTSGHGVCGLGRGSFRSIMAVSLFMGVAILTTYLMELLA